MQFYTHCSRFKSKILCRGYDETGNRVQESINYSPTLFVEGRVEEDKKWFNVYNKPVAPMHFDSMYEATDFANRYKDTDGFTVYGMTNYIYPYLNERFPEVDFNFNNIRIGYIDIETSSEGGFPDTKQGNHEIYLISLKFRSTMYVFSWGKLNEYKKNEDDVLFFACDDEKEMLFKFVNVWKQLDLDIISGFNHNLFDIPYIYSRFVRIFEDGDKIFRELSPFKQINVRMQEVMGKEFPIVDIVGVSILDYIDLYKKFGYRILESYSLNHVAYTELGEKKLSYDEYSSLEDLYNKNPQRYVEYNIRDTRLVEKLERKKALIQLVVIMAYACKINYTDCFSSVRSWDVLIHNYLWNTGKVVPTHGSGIAKIRQIAGGYVKNPQVGKHGWCASFDATSLYPHIAIQYNISPEKYIGKWKKIIDVDDMVKNRALSDPELQDYLKNNNCCIGGASTLFKQDGAGFIPNIMSMLFKKRQQYKKEMIAQENRLAHNTDKTAKQKIEYEISKFNSLQMAFKILLNAGYGAFSNEYFRWYSDDLAESITLSGQLSIKWAEKTVNKLLNGICNNTKDYVIAIDTDSVYVSLDDIIAMSSLDTTDAQKVVDFIDKMSEETIRPLFNKSLSNLQVLTNCREQKIDMKRELIGDRAFWLSAKHYIINYWDAEGVRYQEPRLKMLGIEAIKSSTPEVCRIAIKNAINIIMRKTEKDLQDFIKEFRAKYNTLRFEELAFPRGVNNIDQYIEGDGFAKGTPINVKGAIIFNKLIDKYDLHIPPITSGTKIRFCYLMEPNPTGCNVIATPNFLPEEFHLENFIDRNKMFDKTFIQPILSITQHIGWDVEKRAKITKFFGKNKETT
jgi:DNA polymerase elongation subunit (family B)